LGEEEERTYRRGLELTLDYLQRLEPHLVSTRMDDGNAWPDRVVGTWHHMGTTRMHENPRKGVVDADCTVHGVDNLHAAGSSVFPTSGTHAPTLTILALSIRLSDHLKSLPDLK